jgi:hypothetical protein
MPEESTPKPITADPEEQELLTDLGVSLTAPKVEEEPDTPPEPEAASAADAVATADEGTQAAEPTEPEEAAAAPVPAAAAPAEPAEVPQDDKPAVVVTTQAPAPDDIEKDLGAAIEAVAADDLLTDGQKAAERARLKAQLATYQRDRRNDAAREQQELQAESAYAGYTGLPPEEERQAAAQPAVEHHAGLYLLTGLTGQKAGDIGLGAPNTSTNVLVSSTKTATKKEKMFAEVAYRPTIQYATPSRRRQDDGAVQLRARPLDGATNNPAPTSSSRKPASTSAPTRMKSPTTRSRPSSPTQRRLARSGNDRHRQHHGCRGQDGRSQHLKYWNQLLWGTTGNGYPSNQSAVKWDALHSLAYSIGPDTQVTSNPYRRNNYGGLDRSLTANASGAARAPTPTATSSSAT